mmetsp:Transcript_8003/g.15134  ORF Transcript_8003/g.15134 Transcript_8003/m.15134 type:complete len:89 (+) Transcript_8003:773-1039(+)
MRLLAVACVELTISQALPLNLKTIKSGKFSAGRARVLSSRVAAYAELAIHHAMSLKLKELEASFSWGASNWRGKSSRCAQSMTFCSWP